ncbi:hypothetical protein PAXRUDRAFT_458313 [Paxillus rubicundulus Ve08.2h10]|uniref:Unplaced genomic scaffold scaffold_295, whole genome shotgun sequence n=1 Tax=Paxillus rubicundulus Ve08.2h10 TaxID=930991 RepID=A0A0D0E7S9_9AGAM|nr:hypothetical protein PAXRUDRAFT_458313 [Paxillus rubicundulus Ve08.2h10]
MRTVTTTVIADSPQAYEDRHVHAVYDQIAEHFSSTRYKPWPIITKFLSDLPVGWIGLDSGTGNGKYLPLPAERPGSVLTVGLDRSRNLLQIAQHAGGRPGAPIMREVVWGDVLGNGWRAGAFDYAISIATIHHLASYERRKLGIQRLLQCVSPAHGRILVYVWSIEQDELSKRSIPVDAIYEAESLGTDVFVPWVMPQQNASRSKPRGQTSARDQQTQPSGASETTVATYNRYYHMFAKGELTRLTCEAAEEMDLIVGSPEGVERRGVEIIQDGWERSNYYVELRCWKT